MAHRIRNQSGFTLLEMIVVVAILATVAGIGVLSLGGATQATNEQLARAEMANIANAIRRFRADTGYWPKEGPFRQDEADIDPSTDTEVGLYPASFSQLLTTPVFDHDDDVLTPRIEILPYDSASGTGWDGPYLKELQPVWVSVGDQLAASGAQSIVVNNRGFEPARGNIRQVQGIGDPFPRSRQVGETFYLWRLARVSGNRLSDIPASQDQLEGNGNPYFYFIATAAESNVTGCQVPCILSMGSDGLYDAGGGDDIVVNISANF